MPAAPLSDRLTRSITPPGVTALRRPPRASQPPLDELLHDETPLSEIEIESALPDDAMPYPVSRRLARFLARLVLQHDRHRVLEFGAGSSSVVFARALAARGGRGSLTSVERSPQWCREQWARVAATARVDARLITADLVLRIGGRGIYHEFRRARRAVRERAPYDLLFIDAPQSFYGRDGSLHLAADALAPGALIVLDDAGRRGEQRTLLRWLRQYPQLDLALFDPTFANKGVAVLRHRQTSPLSRHTFSPSAVASSAWAALKNAAFRVWDRSRLAEWME